jgi:hypothetical protein
MCCYKQGTEIGRQFHQPDARRDGLIHVVAVAERNGRFDQLNRIPNELRGTGIAIFTTVFGLIGGGAGSVLIAVISDHMYGGKATLGLAMATLIGFCCPIAAVLLYLGFGAMREAMAEAEKPATVVSHA